ncbi:metallophosphoesterase [Alloscardovia macacae]|uniref:Serine/threonine protein phosphatase n=1 Tax=Alloscardovia macacae TaxID=1160091 RepID=A0A1Y2SWF5_9BIFI|nr:metallophosphoesterase [Alloscardovia macacae]OTA26635.1 serine/threonine protein phosphatase [Alloscardovia macacae]OTA28987.1 serine/threonine protein phosphatase [Alloscardovia macacae]OZG54956.1 serine/threonine protein phosphatase [Alloscardovia macacae]
MTEQNASGTVDSGRIDSREASAPASTSVSARLGQLQFHASGKFRVLQVSDNQDGPKVSKDTVRLIAAACDAARPDIVIFTGNQIAGYDTAYAPTFVKRTWLDRQLEPSAEEKERTRQIVRSTLAAFLEPVVSRHIPFAVTFGNHDFQCGLSLDELTELYREFPGCVNPRRDTPNASGDTPSEQGDTPNVLLPHQRVYDSGEAGTFALPVRDQYNEANLLGLTIVNSGDYAQEGGYAAPSSRALQFVKHVPREMNVRAMAFQHMPVQKYYDLLRPVPVTTANAIQGYRAFESYSYVLDENRTLPGSYLGEGISCPDRDTNEFRFLQEHNYFALAAAHDHRNAIAGVVDGILLASTPTAGFSTYGPSPENRGVRLFEFDVRHPFEPRTQLLEFGDLVGKPSGNKAYALASTYMPNNTGEAINLLRKPKVLASVAAVVAGIISVLTFGRGGSRGGRK